MQGWQRTLWGILDALPEVVYEKKVPPEDVEIIAVECTSLTPPEPLIRYIKSNVTSTLIGPWIEVAPQRLLFPPPIKLIG